MAATKFLQVEKFVKGGVTERATEGHSHFAPVTFFSCKT